MSGTGPTSNSTTAVVLSEHLQREFLQKISDLDEKLRSNAPGYESLLHTIHRQLAADESLVHILDEEQVGTIVRGLTKRKNIVLAEPEKRGRGAGGKSLKNIGLDDLEQQPEYCKAKENASR